MLKNKAQAAMDFLVSYGWVFFVMLAVIGNLAYFGVISPGRIIPSRCSFPSEFECIDHVLSTNSLILRLKNNAGESIVVLSINATSEAFQFSCRNPPQNPSSWKHSEIIDVEWANCSGAGLIAGESQKLDVAISYYSLDSSPAFSKEANGEIYATVYPGVSTQETGKSQPKPPEQSPQSNSSYATKSGDLPNLYNITLQDPNGIFLFFVQNAKGKIISGGIAFCLKKGTVGPFSIKQNEFPLTAYYNDCKNIFKTKTAEIDKPT